MDPLKIKWWNKVSVDMKLSPQHMKNDGYETKLNKHTFGSTQEIRAN